MNPIDAIKQYINLIIGVATLACVGFALWYVHDLKSQLADAKQEHADHIAADQAAVNEATKLSEATNATVQLQHTKDLLAVKTRAGSDAVNGYLAKHGLLPSGGTVCSEQPSAGSQTIRTQGSDATPSKQRTGPSSQSFAERCATDALTVLGWQEWAHGNGLEIK